MNNEQMPCCVPFQGDDDEAEKMLLLALLLAFGSKSDDVQGGSDKDEAQILLRSNPPSDI